MTNCFYCDIQCENMFASKHKKSNKNNVMNINKDVTFHEVTAVVGLSDLSRTEKYVCDIFELEALQLL